jgi:hypothetical protein
MYAELLQLHPSRKREASSSVISRLQPCEGRRAQRAPKGSSGRTFFSKFTSPEQSYAAALRQDTQHQQLQAPQTDGKCSRHPVQQHLPQEEIQKTRLSVQAPSSPNSETLKLAPVVRHIMRKLSEAVSE